MLPSISFQLRCNLICIALQLTLIQSTGVAQNRYSRI